MKAKFLILACLAMVCQAFVPIDRDGTVEVEIEDPAPVVLEGYLPIPQPTLQPGMILTVDESGDVVEVAAPDYGEEPVFRQHEPETGKHTIAEGTW